jgi:hypothetical protein
MHTLFAFGSGELQVYGGLKKKRGRAKCLKKKGLLWIITMLKHIVSEMISVSF